MSKKAKIIIACVFVFLACLTSYFEGRKSVKIKTETKVVTDTLIVKDTIRISEVIEVKRKVIDTLFFPIVDTIQIHDTTFITLYKEVKVYEDSLFKAQISGVEPQLDWIEVYPQTQYINTTETIIKSKDKPWGLGVQLGVGVCRGGLATPYIGLGISYDLVSW